MKRLFLLLLLLGFTTFSFGTGSTIEQIFLQIPMVYFRAFEENGVGQLNAQVRKQLLTTYKSGQLILFLIDPKSGYLHLGTESDGWSMQATITYWRFGNSTLVGLTIDKEDGCSNKSEEVYFFEYANGKLVDISQRFKPDLSLKRFDITDTKVLQSFDGMKHTIWRLPQIGKVITIKPFYYVCGGDGFEGSPVYYEIEPTSMNAYRLVKKYGKNVNK
ncbi:MAG: hypothetical protein U0Y10_19380 [Spirosomataceae bacterium]